MGYMIYIWANYNNSLTWNKAILGMIPLTNHYSSEVAVRSQWGRYILPRYMIPDGTWWDIWDFPESHVTDYCDWLLKGNHSIMMFHHICVCIYIYYIIYNIQSNIFAWIIYNIIYYIYNIQSIIYNIIYIYVCAYTG